MNDLFEKIYEYNCMFIQGMLFVGLKAIFTKWWLVLISIPVGMTSLFGIFYSYILEFKKGDFFGLVIAFLLFFFVFFVPVIYYARKAVDKEIIARTKRKYGILFESREKAVAYSLAKIFDISTDKFWDYADTLKKVRIHYFSLEDPISSTNYFKFIYDPDSKARIYALFLAFVAIIAARTFYHETPISLTDVMELYFTNFSVTLRYWVAIIISTGILLFSLWSIFLFVFIFARGIGFVFFLTRYSRNQYAIKRLEKILLELHNISIETEENASDGSPENFDA